MEESAGAKEEKEPAANAPGGELNQTQSPQDERKGMEAPVVVEVEPLPVKTETIDELVSVDLQGVADSTKETLSSLADSLKEMLSSLMKQNDVVSSKLLGSLLVPAGGSSVVDQLLNKVSPGADHQLGKRDRQLRGRWRLGRSRLQLQLADGRVRILRLPDSDAADLDLNADQEDPSLSPLSSERLLGLIANGTGGAALLKAMEQQLRELLQGSTPVNWTGWLQTLPSVMAGQGPLQAWRTRNQLQGLQQELASLTQIDPALVDVVMAAELVSCLEAFGIDAIAAASPREATETIWVE